MSNLSHIRVPWQLAVATILLVLLAMLATLQYRWLGAVSDAERERMRAGLRSRTSELAREFDAELARIYVAFHVDNDSLDRDPRVTLRDAYQSWRSSATDADLLRAVFLVEQRSGQAAKALRRLDVGGGVLVPAEWPADVAAVFARALPPPPTVADLPAPWPLLMAETIDAQIPALFIPVPFLKKISGPPFTMVTTVPDTTRAVVVVLDRDRLQHNVLEPLVAKHFGEPHASDYLVTIVRRDDPSTLVYSSGDRPVDASNAGVTADLFALRLDAMDRVAVADNAVRAHPTQRVAITVLRRTNPGNGIFMAGGEDRGAWQVRVRHRSGSLDAIVAQSRRRNLAISLGVLGLLGASVVLILGAAQRQQRLARQQMEFVAAVSHELRTPLAVICSAGENLADGVVSEGAQVLRYGSLIHSEGRRLREMVERVLEFSGIRSAGPMPPFVAVNLLAVIRDAVDAVNREACEHGVTVAVHANGTVPAVRGDASALRSAVVNIVGNAVKYSPAGGTVDVSTAARGSRVQLRVVDRGLGIDRDDLPHIFKPFYRGRRAIDAQVRGTGIGLSVVRHVVDAHHGEIHVESRPGEGTAVTVELPAASGASDMAPSLGRVGQGGRAGQGGGRPDPADLPDRPGLPDPSP
jgi:signal transduction histidine kinase